MWATFSSVTKFSIIAFLVSGVLGLFSMGALGYGLYFLVKPVLGNRINELQGDTMWPAMILAGMAWSMAFLIAAWCYHWLLKFDLPQAIMNFSYAFILWGWILIVWFIIIHFRVVS
jgi:hypothetical protein